MHILSWCWTNSLSALTSFTSFWYKSLENVTWWTWHHSWYQMSLIHRDYAIVKRNIIVGYIVILVQKNRSVSPKLSAFITGQRSLGSHNDNLFNFFCQFSTVFNSKGFSKICLKCGRRKSSVIWIKASSIYLYYKPWQNKSFVHTFYHT